MNENSNFMFLDSKYVHKINHIMANKESGEQISECFQDGCVSELIITL